MADVGMSGQRVAKCTPGNHAEPEGKSTGNEKCEELSKVQDE